MQVGATGEQPLHLPIGIELQGSLRLSPGQNPERVALTSVSLPEVLKVNCDVDRRQAGSEYEEAWGKLLRIFASSLNF